MSKTPRTDNEEFSIGFGRKAVVYASFARRLERENVELRKLVEQIAEQKLLSELTESEQINFEGCCEDAYEYMIRDAREVLKKVGDR